MDNIVSSFSSVVHRHMSAIELEYKVYIDYVETHVQFCTSWKKTIWKLIAQICLRDAAKWTEYPSPVGSELNREDYPHPTDLILKGKLLVYMLQSQYGSTIDNNMLGHWDANTIK